ncbi:MAG TPA: T9SS type A sorting domain-containing protein [Bacteroidia bacterium]|nr:T9SS type A sorting domain-containing protein [Bacteroidia bacterium]
MKKQLFTLALGAIGLSAFSQSTVWQSYNSNVAPNTYIQHLSVVDTDVVWGLDGNLYNMFTRTIDGSNFHSGKFNPDTNTYQAAGISAVNANTAYITSFAKAGGQGQIVKTTDGGATWNSVITAGMYSGSLAFPDWIHFWDANNGIVFGDPDGNTATGAVDMFEIYRTHDGGTTWTQVDSASMDVPLSGDAGFTSSFAVYKHFLWAGTFNGFVYASADSGKTWHYPTSNSIGLDGGCTGVAFRDSIHGMAWGADAGGNNVTVATADGGVTWTPVFMGTSVGVNAICNIPKTKGFMSVGIDSTGANDFVTSVTYDDGATWTVLETTTVLSDNSKRMLSVQMIDSLNGWAGNFSDTSYLYPRGKGGINRFHLGHKPGCPIGLQSTTTASVPFNVCQGSSITLTASGLTTYTWSTAAMTASVSVSPTVNTTYSVAGTAPGGCTNYDMINVTVISGTVTSTVASHTVCPGTSTPLHVSGATTYSWMPSTGLSVTTGTASTSTTTVNVTYTITGTKNNCPLSPDTIAMIMKPAPTLTVTASPTGTVCPNSVVVLTANTNGTNYTWNTSATTVSVSVTPSVTSTYTVSVTTPATNTCVTKGTITVTVSTCAGIDNYSSSNNISVYPNPSTGLVTLSLSSVDAGTVMYVTNVIGQQVSKTVIKDLTTNFDFSGLEKGIYMITITNGASKHIEKLIIQ